MTSRLTASYYPADTSLSVWDMTTGDALRRAAERAGHLCALVEVAHESVPAVSKGSNADRRWTYSELLADAEACARWLLDRFEPGDHICLWAPNVPEWIIVQYGAAFAGLVLVTANPSLRAEELQHVLEQSDSKAIIHSKAFRGTDMEQIASTAASAIDRIPIEDLAVTLSQWRNSSTLPEVSPHAAAQMQFTSGTTGRPKGALLSHRALVTNAAFVARRAGRGHQPVYHGPAGDLRPRSHACDDRARKGDGDLLRADDAVGDDRRDRPGRIRSIEPAHGLFWRRPGGARNARARRTAFRVQDDVGLRADRAQSDCLRDGL